MKKSTQFHEWDDDIIYAAQVMIKVYEKTGQPIPAILTKMAGEMDEQVSRPGRIETAYKRFLRSYRQRRA